MTSSSINGYTTTYAFGGEGRRVTKYVASTGDWTYYVYDGMGNLAAEYTTSLTRMACKTCYFMADHLGSTRMLTDASRNVISLHDFLPFGEEIPSSVDGRDATWGNVDPTQRFTGQERDAETALDYFDFRYFSGAQGRFASADEPLTFADAENPQSWNLYSYGLNNPLLYSDPTGHEPCVDGVNPDNGHLCTVVTAVAPPVQTKPSPVSELALDVAIPTLVVAVQFQQNLKSAANSVGDWFSQPRNPLCTAGYSALGA